MDRAELGCGAQLWKVDVDQANVASARPQDLVAFREVEGPTGYGTTSSSRRVRAEETIWIAPTSAARKAGSPAPLACLAIFAQSTTMPMVSILALDGCHAGTVFGLRDVFGVANPVGEILSGDRHSAIQLQLLGLTGRSVRAADQTTIRVDAAVGSAELGQTLIVPGCMTDPERLETLVPTQDRVASLLRRYHAAGGTVVAHCSSIFIVGRAGLLAGRRATATWWAQDLFRRLFPEASLLENAAITDDRRVICAAGPFSQHQLGMHIVEKVQGEAVASLLARFALIDRNPMGQDAFRAAHFQPQNYPLSYNIELIVRRRLPTAPSVRAVAAELGLSIRTLQRKLTASGHAHAKAVIDRVRMDVAKEMLSGSEASLDEVASATGYGDASAFWRAFARFSPFTPSVYRKRAKRAMAGGT